jgi:hypothetical protein
MQPGRFVTLCFLYSGLLLLAQFVAFSGLRLDLGSLSQLGIALVVLLTGVARLWLPDEEATNPSSWGLFTAGMAVLAVSLTVLFLAQLALQ